MSYHNQNDDTVMGRAGPVLLTIWISFNLIFNTILLPIVVVTILLAKRAKRHLTLVNLLATWIFSGVFSNILFFANKYNGPEPPKGLCIAQSSLLYGITPMWSVSVYMLFWFMSVAICGDREKSVIKTPKLIVMLASPYMTQIVFSVTALVLSLNHPDLVTRKFRFFYCALHHTKLALVMSLFTLVMCAGIIKLQVCLAITAYRNWCCLREANQHNGVDFQFYLRVLTFGAFVTFGMSVNLVFLFNPMSVVPDIFLATAGAVVFFIFGTQCDIIGVWFFWRPPPPPAPPEEPVLEWKRTSFWRRSEATFEQDSAELFKDLPPPPPPKSREYLISIGAKVPDIGETSP